MRSMTRYATTVHAPPIARTANPAGVSYAAAASGRVASSARTIHGAATASRARVHRPALPRLELAARPDVLAQERRQGAQEPAEVRAADVAGQAQRLDDPVRDRVREPRLERVEAVAEPPGRPVVLGERA